MTYTCRHCNHTWQSRIDRLPVRCPACQSTRWNGPRTQTASNGTNGVNQELLERCKSVSAELVTEGKALNKAGNGGLATVLFNLADTLADAITKAEKEG